MKEENGLEKMAILSGAPIVTCIFGEKKEIKELRKERKKEYLSEAKALSFRGYIEPL